MTVPRKPDGNWGAGDDLLLGYEGDDTLVAGSNTVLLVPGCHPRWKESLGDWGIRVVDEEVGLEPLLAGADTVIGHAGMGLTSMAAKRRACPAIGPRDQLITKGVRV